MFLFSCWVVCLFVLGVFWFLLFVLVLGFGFVLLCFFSLGQRKHMWVLVCVETSQKKASSRQKSLFDSKRYLSEILQTPWLSSPVESLQVPILRGIWELKLITDSHKILCSIWNPSKSLGRLFQASLFKYFSNFSELCLSTRKAARV